MSVEHQIFSKRTICIRSDGQVDESHQSFFALNLNMAYSIIESPLHESPISNYFEIFPP